MVSEISAEDWEKLKELLEKLPLEQRLIGLRKLVLSAPQEIAEEMEQMIHIIEEELSKRENGLVKVIHDSPTSITIESVVEEAENSKYVATELKKYYAPEKRPH